jgi:hypothetical protein
VRGTASNFGRIPSPERPSWFRARAAGITSIAVSMKKTIPGTVRSFCGVIFPPVFILKPVRDIRFDHTINNDLEYHYKKRQEDLLLQAYQFEKNRGQNPRFKTKKRFYYFTVT